MINVEISSNLNSMLNLESGVIKSKIISSNFSHRSISKQGEKDNF
jgi:hypothetical protein